MLSGLKTSAVVLAGLLLGLCLAVPLAWMGTRRGADTLAMNVGNAVAAVEERQQSMADEALQLQPLMQRFGVTRDADLFTKVQAERSRLAGESGLREKLERLQLLEEALLRVERLQVQSGQELRSLRDSEEFQAYARTWDKQKRLLVREQLGLEDSVAELNHLLLRWPASRLLAYRSLSSLAHGLIADLKADAAYRWRWSLDYLRFTGRRVVARFRHQPQPEPPKWDPPADTEVVTYLKPLNRPVFLADAPLPEDDYQEVQFTHNVAQNYADVELGEDQAVLENRDAPKPYAPVLPKPQKTVVYSGVN
ncbi:MAG TPA: hypothetical protein VNZ54_02675 [bacterium]|nr:hypothetical protein [bacterium]